MAGMAILFCSSQAAIAQSVRILANEEGQGFLFQHKDNCFVVTAAHVTEGSRRIQIITQAGSEGTATMARPFWPDLDLDIGQVRRIGDQECSVPFDVFKEGAQSPINGVQVVLPLVGFSGAESHKLQVSAAGYLDFYARFADEGMAGRKGMSGAVAMRSGVPLGMVRTTTEDGSVRLTQAAEIALNVERWLTRKVERVDLEEAAVEDTEGTPIELVTSEPSAIGGDYLVEGMLEGTNAFAYQPGQDAKIVLRNAAEGQKTVSRVRVISEPNADFTMPTHVKIELFASEDAKRPYLFDVVPFPADGIYDSGPRSPRFGSIIQMTLIGARDGKPVRLDQIIVE